MWSKNKPKQTASEKQHVARVASLPCVVCGSEEGSEVHEFEQGAWFASVPLCFPCHRGPKGWHGTRDRWSLARMDAIKAINETYRKLMA
ncbi:hypothetical protein ACT80S_18440 [Ramlibacter sp. MAHUQ-53]|uniref:hypothetical protein n=1 Tax=unclassified Ramlibacter TaxID=2617605 RepID=UPI0036410B88